MDFYPRILQRPISKIIIGSFLWSIDYVEPGITTIMTSRTEKSELVPYEVGGQNAWNEHRPKWNLRKKHFGVLFCAILYQISMQCNVYLDLPCWSQGQSHQLPPKIKGNPNTGARECRNVLCQRVLKAFSMWWSREGLTVVSSPGLQTSSMIRWITTQENYMKGILLWIYRARKWLDTPCGTAWHGWNRSAEMGHLLCSRPSSQVS